MSKPQSRLTSLTRSCWGLAVLLLLPFAIGAVPAQAQGLSGFFRALFQPTIPAPAPSYDNRLLPGIEQPRRRVRPRPKPRIVEQPEIRKPIEPRPIGEIDNPVPALLADTTLRRGDMVMFPDGLRVFAGRPGGPHKLADFKPVAQAGKLLSRQTRKHVKHLLPGENIAWDTNAVQSGGKLAANTDDVETTGSVRPPKSRQGSRSR